MRAHLVFVLALAALPGAAACSSPEIGAGEPVGESAAAVTAAEAISRAEEWVTAKLLYCQSPNHQSDTIDPACPPV